MDNLASDVHCGFLRNSNSVLITSSGEISVELHLAVQKVWPNTNSVFPSLNQLKLQGWKRQQYLSRELKVQNLNAGVQRQRCGCEAAVPNILEVGAMPFSSTIPAPTTPAQLCSIHLVASVHHHPGKKKSTAGRQGKELAQKEEGGTDFERFVGSGCQHHLQLNMTQKGTPLVLNCTFSDG